MRFWRHLWTRYLSFFKNIFIRSEPLLSQNFYLTNFRAFKTIYVNNYFLILQPLLDIVEKSQFSTVKSTHVTFLCLKLPMLKYCQKRFKLRITCCHPPRYNCHFIFQFPVEQFSRSIFSNLGEVVCETFSYEISSEISSTFTLIYRAALLAAKTIMVNSPFKPLCSWLCYKKRGHYGEKYFILAKGMRHLYRKTAYINRRESKVSIKNFCV